MICIEVNKVTEVKEAVILYYALNLLMVELMNDTAKYEDRKLFEETFLAVSSLRVKYHKKALQRMFKDGNGNFQILPDN
jgi:hypothetical protein